MDGPAKSRFVRRSGRRRNALSFHPKCFANESGFDALIALVTAHDQRIRLELSRRRPSSAWRSARDFAMRATVIVHAPEVVAAWHGRERAVERKDF